MWKQPRVDRRVRVASVRGTNVVAQIKSRNGRANPDKPKDKWKWKLPECLPCLLRISFFLYFHYCTQILETSHLILFRT